MKFSRQLEYSAYPPWNVHYLAYRRLKRLIKTQKSAGLSLQATWIEFLTELADQAVAMAEFFSGTFRESRSACESTLDRLSGGIFRGKGGTVAGRKFREDCVHLFLELDEIRNYCLLNVEGNRKLLKKFDKCNGTLLGSAVRFERDRVSLNGESGETRVILEELVRQLNSMLLVLPSIKEIKHRFIQMYAVNFTNGNLPSALEDLTLDMSELLVDKRTVWSDLLKMREPAPQRPLVVITAHLVILGVFGFLLAVNYKSRATRCFALLWLVAGFWSLGFVPLFVTALLVPFAVVALEVLPVPFAVASQTVLGHFWGPAQSLVFSSFAVAGAVTKTRLDKVFLCHFISSDRQPQVLRLMLLGWLASGIVGNVAASVICITAASSALKTLDESSDHELGRILLLGIAIACNLGGMLSPVASPHNVVAFSALAPLGVTFSHWFIVAAPLSAASFALGYLWIKLSWKRLERTRSEIEQRSEITLPLLSSVSARRLASFHPEEPPTRSRAQWFVIMVGLFTVSMWVCGNSLVLGVACLVPTGVLFATVLSKADFMSLPWDVCMLLGGGSVLGLAVKESQLLALVSAHVPTNLLGWAFAMTAASSVVSHTAAANVLMPFVVETAKKFASPVSFALPVSLCLSLGMAFPVSSFPNVNTLSATRRSGNPWVVPTDFMLPGLIVSGLSTLLCAGFGGFLTGFLL